MATHRIHVLVELDVTDEEWQLSYGSSETPTQIAEYIDSVLNDAVRGQIERSGWGEVVRTTGTVHSTTAEPVG